MTEPNQPDPMSSLTPELAKRVAVFVASLRDELVARGIRGDRTLAISVDVAARVGNIRDVGAMMGQLAGALTAKKQPALDGVCEDCGKADMECECDP